MAPQIKNPPSAPAVWTSPKTGKTYKVKRGRFQESFVYEMEEGKTIEDVRRDFAATDADCARLWGKAPLPYPSKTGMVKLGPIWGFKDRASFTAPNIVALNFSQLPHYPGPIESNFGPEGPNNATSANTYLKCHKRIVPQLSRALSRIFAYSKKS